MNVLKLVDVINIGIEKEKARRDFYGHTAKIFNEGEVKVLFERLRDWESGHIKKFESIRNSVESHSAIESYSGEMAEYMDALIDNKLYDEVSPENFADHVKNPLHAIQYSIGFEKDAILLFQEMLPYVQESNKESIHNLIKEERQHIVYLINLRKKYQ